MDNGKRDKDTIVTQKRPATGRNIEPNISEVKHLPGDKKMGKIKLFRVKIRVSFFLLPQLAVTLDRDPRRPCRVCLPTV